MVGGGVIGCAIARELALRGVDVTLIERDVPGRQASWAAAGMLSPVGEAAGGGPFLELSDVSLSAFAAFADALRAETSIDIEYRTTGRLVLSMGESDELLRQLATSPDAPRFGMHLLDSREARTLEPAISSAVTSGLLIERDHRVDNRRLVRALVAAADAAGVTLLTGDGVVSLLRQGGGVQGVRLESGTEVRVDHVILAAGAWTGRIGGLPRAVPVRPVKGQMFSVQGDGRIEHVIMAAGCYIIPRDDGKLLVGATVEDAGFSEGTTPHGMSSLMSSAVAVVPTIAELPITETWSGLRPGTPDDLPIIGADPDVDGLFYATGHYRNGILLTPVTARCVADLVLGGSGSALLDAFAVDRFT